MKFTKETERSLTIDDTNVCKNVLCLEASEKKRERMKTLLVSILVIDGNITQIGFDFGVIFQFGSIFPCSKVNVSFHRLGW